MTLNGDTISGNYVCLDYGSGLVYTPRSSEIGAEIVVDDPLKFRDKLRDGRMVRNYAVVTNTPERYRELFVSNNIIDSRMKDKAHLDAEVRWVLSNSGRKDSPKPGRVFFTSDTHFSHRNIIKYCNRPWNSGFDEIGEMIITDSDVERMNEELIENWNAVVTEDDTVWHLGDFALGDKKKIPGIVERLNGKINLVMGNHDNRPMKFYYDCGFRKVYDRPVLWNDYFILSHEPVMIGVNDFRVNLFGHVHDSGAYNTFSKTSCCICVERWDYAPVRYERIVEGLKELRGDE